MTFGMWRKGWNSTAGDVLLTALHYTDISETELKEIIEILSTASERTRYVENPEEPQESAPLKSAMELRDNRHGKFTLEPFTPRQLTEWLHTKGGIVRQDEAVKAAALIAYNHCMGRPSVSLFAGPSGSGKTEIWRALCRKFGTEKIVIIDGSSLTAEGWKGNLKISSVFQNIAPENRNNLILVIDEMDKLLEPQITSGETNYSYMIQNQLLKLFDHDKLIFPAEHEKDKPTIVDAAGISVVGLGAFENLLKFKSAQTSSIGFGGQQRQQYDYSNTMITSEDLIASGMRRELCGRVNKVVALEPLTTETLIRIARNETAKLSAQMQCDVLVDNNTLAKLADEAIDKKLGARWINAQLRNMLDELIFENPDAEKYLLGAKDTVKIMTDT